MARLEQGKLCPLLNKDCVGLTCSWYTQVRGTDPQSGREVDEYACAVAWLPMLLIETSKEVRQGAAATESLRNQVAATSATSIKLQLAIAGITKGLPQLAAASEKEGNHEEN